MWCCAPCLPSSKNVWQHRDHRSVDAGLLVNYWRPEGIALCVGIEDYSGLSEDYQGLACCKRDADSMNRLLCSFGIDSTLALDPSVSQLDAILDDMAARAKLAGASLDSMNGSDNEAQQPGRRAPEMLLFYFAGHAEMRMNQNCLLLACNSGGKQCDLPLDSILHRLAKMAHRHTIVIVFLDACRNRVPSPLGEITEVPSRRQFYVASACLPGSRATEDTMSGHGYFTKHLLAELKPFISVEDVMLRVTQKVCQDRHNLQRPSVFTCCNERVTIRRKLHQIPARNMYFVGRENELSLLAGMCFKPVQPTVIGIHCMAGLGKTQLVIEFLHREVLRTCPIVWWVNGETPGTVAASLRILAERLGVAQAKAEYSEALQALIQHLEGKGASDNTGSPVWVIVFDNVGEAPLPLPEATLGRGLVFITSRDMRRFPVWAKRLELMNFERPDSVQLLQAFTGIRHDEDGAHSVANLLQDHPLAVAQAAAYIHNTGNAISFALFVKLFSEASLEELGFRGPLRESTGYEHTIASIWQLMKQQLSKQCPLALDLMCFMALIYPDSIEFDLLRVFSQTGLPWAKLWCLKTKTDFVEALRVLRGHSLISSASGTQFSIHRLTQRIVQEDLKRSQRHRVLCDRVFESLLAGRHFEWLHADDKVLNGEHLRAAVHACHALHVSPVILCRARVCLSAYLFEQVGESDLAKRLMREEISKWPQHSVQSVACHFALGAIMSHEQNSPAQTCSYLTLAYDRGHYLKDASELVTAAAAMLLQEYAAERDATLAERFVDDVKAGTNSKDCRIACDCHYALALWFELCQENFNSADRHYDFAAELAKNYLGSGGPRALARILDDRSTLHRNKDDLCFARSLAEEAVRTIRDHFSDSDRSLASKLVSLGSIISDQGNWQGALPLFEEALDICCKRGDDYSRKYASASRHAGIALRHIGKPQEGLKHLKNALSILGTLMSPTHDVVVQCYVEACLCHLDLGSLREARAAINKAESCSALAVERSSKAKASFWNARARVLMQEGDHVESASDFSLAQQAMSSGPSFQYRPR